MSVSGKEDSDSVVAESEEDEQGDPVRSQSETDDSDGNDVFDNVSNENSDEDDYENSGSDLDVSHQKSALGDKVQIEKIKHELLERFKTKLEVLQTEKKWFSKRCELKTKVGDAIKELRDAYKGFSNARNDLPKESLSEFRLELGKTLSRTKLTRKLCAVVCKMYPREYRLDNEYLYIDFENTFDLISGFVDASDIIAREVASVDVFLDNLVEMMKDTRTLMLKDNLCEADTELQKKAFECLHNLAMDHRNYQKLRDKNFVEIIMSYFETDSSDDGRQGKRMSIGLILTAFGALAALMDERESEAEGRQDEVVEFFKEKLKEAIDNEDDDCWSPRKIVRTIRRLAQNDCYKKAFGRTGILALLVEVAQRDSIRDQAESTGAIWTLSFIEENQKKLIANTDTMTMLQIKRHSQNKTISTNCQGTLWNMRGLLNTQTKYRHLVSWSSSVEDSQDAQVYDDDNINARGQNENKESSSSHIMISYQWGNQKTLIKVRDRLRNKGYKVWMDIDNMRGSTLEAMAEAVERASVVLICMSQKYKNSPNCRLEAEYAFQQEKTIIPLKMEKGYRADGWLGLLIGTKLFFEFSGKYPFEDKMRDLLKELTNTVPVVEEKKTVTFRGTKISNAEATIATLRRQKTEPFISLSQLNALRSAFSAFDSDESDRLCISELGDVLRSVGLNPTQAEIDDVMINADSNGNGYIDYNEYVSLLKSYMKPQAEVERELRDAFKLFSKGHGKVNQKQLRLALTKLGERLSEREAEELFDLMDVNEDGEVDIDEFVTHLCGK